MKLFAVAAVLGFATPVFLQKTYTLWYDIIYDGTTTSLSNTACSTGEYGLITYGYNNMGEIPTYPNLGGAPQIQSWNSPYCGSCWNLTYTDPHGVSSSATFTAVDTGNQGGFTIAFAAMDVITNGNALTLDGISVTATQLPASACGM